MEIAAGFVALAAILFVLCFIAGEDRRKVREEEEMVRTFAKARERDTFVVIANDERAREAREQLWKEFGE